MHPHPRCLAGSYVFPFSVAAAFPTFPNTVLSLSNGQRLLAGLDLFAPPSVLNCEASSGQSQCPSVSCCPVVRQQQPVIRSIKLKRLLMCTGPPLAGPKFAPFVYRLGKCPSAMSFAPLPINSFGSVRGKKLTSSPYGSPYESMEVMLYCSLDVDIKIFFNK